MSGAQKDTNQEVTSDADFSLWRFLDHTRYMIARLRKTELARVGLTPEQVHILDILVHDNGSSTINKIVEITARQHHSISTQINRMALQGLVRKVKSTDDSRKYTIKITRKGRNLFGQVNTDSIKTIFSVLSDEEKQVFYFHLEKLIRQVHREIGTEYTTPSEVLKRR